MELIWPLKGSSLFRVGVRSLLAAAECLDNVHEPPDILDPPLCAPSLLFLLLASLDLGGLASDLSSTSGRSVDLSSLEGDGQVDGLVLEEGKAHLILRGAPEQKRFSCSASTPSRR